MEAAARPTAALPYREDCWSDGETSALVDAWGDRYIELSRGNLRQQHWQEVADAVNSRRRTGGAAAAPRRPPRTDVQCKNRIDTLKKKYKAERAKIADSGGAEESHWRFYSRLDALIGPSATPAPAAAPNPAPPPPLALPLPYRRNASPLPPAAATVDSKRPRFSLPVNDSIYRQAAAAAAAAASDEDDDDSSSSSSSKSSTGGRSRRAGRTIDEADGIVELAQAIERFGEIYERVEGAKQRQVMELEKQRMEFAKALEFERMQIFVDTQIQLANLKRAKRVDASEQGGVIAVGF